MKIKFLESVAGMGFAYGRGTIADVPKDLAKSFLKCKIAELCDQVSENNKPIAKEPKELTKKDYWKILEAKGIQFKKTFGINRLKQLV